MKDWMRQRSGDWKRQPRPRLERRQKKIHVNKQRIEWDRKGEIKKDRCEFILKKRQKKIKDDG